MISRERVTGGRDTQDFELRGREQREKRCGRGVGEFRIDGTRRGDRRRRVERRVTTRRSTSPFASIWIFNRGQHARIRLSKCRFHDFRSTPLLVLRESVERSLHLEIQYTSRPRRGASPIQHAFSTPVMSDARLCSGPQPIEVDRVSSMDLITITHRDILTLILLAHIDAPLAWPPHIASEMCALTRTASGRYVRLATYPSNHGSGRLIEGRTGGLSARVLRRRGRRFTQSLRSGHGRLGVRVGLV
jgi:hypothetical protein